VKFPRDARALIQPLFLTQPDPRRDLPQPVAVGRKSQTGRHRQRQAFKPRAPPERRKNHEIDFGGRSALLAL